MQEFTKENEGTVLGKKGLSVVDFNAVWCAPCRMLGKVIDAVAEERNDVDIYSCDVDDNDELANKYNVGSIPHLAFIKDGVVVHTNIGYISKDYLNELIDKYAKQ